MRKKKRRLSVFIMVILILTVGMAGIRTAEGYAAWQQDSAGIAQGIATEIIRFHVRANSDSEADQQLKLQVKDRVVTYMEPLLRESQDIEQSRQILEEQTENIRTLALDTLREAGSDYDVAVYFENSYFPMKSYGDVTFPPGEYEAFRIDIGAHDGKNWWCVLYPPLCFVDTSYGVLPDTSKDTLKNNTNENIQGEESVQSQQVDINIVYEEVHRMANTIIIPEDGNKWGEDEITKERIEKVLYELNGRDDYLNKELNKWNNSDFSNGVKVHNYVWSKLGGTIGKAKSLNDVNVQKAINLLNN